MAPRARRRKGGLLEDEGVATLADAALFPDPQDEDADVEAATHPCRRRLPAAGSSVP